MDKFTRELESGEIHVRDRWQFELKSEFFPDYSLKGAAYTQEFYIFIPNALQINANSYTKQDFFNDQTNFIRYKTPVFTLGELIDPNNIGSPIARIQRLKQEALTPETAQAVEEELKLLGNIVRSAIRRKMHQFVTLLESRENDREFSEKLNVLDEKIDRFFEIFGGLRGEFLEKEIPESLSHCFTHIHDFIGQSVNYYYTGLLNKVRRINKKSLNPSDKLICERLIQYAEPIKEIEEEGEKSGEFILYRSSLLNKYVLDALLLRTTRSSPDRRLKNIIGSFAAGVAMLVYFLLFIWQGKVFLINSEPFILATVVLYILKDRLKEGLKALSYKQAFRWFSDSTTKIYDPKGKTILGKLKESFSFVREKSLPKEIRRIRNSEFHDLLEDFKRPEKVIFYKRTIEMHEPKPKEPRRRFCLNIIFRYNILKYLTKADNPYHFYVALDRDTRKLLKTRLPKIYHLNIIMRNSYFEKNGTRKEETKKFRLILDKKGIKRLESV